MTPRISKYYSKYQLVNMRKWLPKKYRKERNLGLLQNPKYELRL